jgi:methylenetetrahydrofolate dehydrogenase (NADP+)/methenyltetrahydrofolate cyclohydrolase
MTIFDGNAFAAAQETTLKLRMAQLAKRQVSIKVAAILFVEDAGSQLYSRLKQESANRIGLEYELYSYSLNDSKEAILQKIAALNTDPSVTGIIIQKPWTALWTQVTGKAKADFENWWVSLVTSISEAKDVDGLHPQTLAAIKRGTWRAEGKVLPATARAVVAILESAKLWQTNFKYTIIGKSDILGKPLYYELLNKKCEVEMIGSKELREKIEQEKFLYDADVVITATGRQHLITGALLKSGVALIDVGEPRPDVDRASVAEKASFLTPVPGGVGPVTVVSLMANALDLVV